MRLTSDSGVKLFVSETRYPAFVAVARFRNIEATMRRTRKRGAIRVPTTAATLTVPGTRPEIPSPQVGLPLAHVFSGGETSGVTVMAPSGRRWDQPLGYHAGGQAPILTIAPRSSVGVTVDLREYFPALRGAGEFRVSWQPYAGAVAGESVLLSVASLKQAEIVTDEGKGLDPGATHHGSRTQVANPDLLQVRDPFGQIAPRPIVRQTSRPAISANKRSRSSRASHFWSRPIYRPWKAACRE